MSIRELWIETRMVVKSRRRMDHAESSARIEYRPQPIIQCWVITIPRKILEGDRLLAGNNQDVG
jgi:hypothetical protein